MKLPDLTTQESPVPQPSMGVVSYRGGQQGDYIERVGEDMLIEARKEQDKLDTLEAEDALNRLRETQLDMTHGEQNGFANVRGQDALKPDFYQKRTQSFQDAAKQIMQGLSPSAQEKFKPRAGMANIQFKEGLLRHSAAEGDTFAKNTYVATIKVEAEAAKQMYLNPNAVAASITRVQSANNDMAKRFGWDEKKRQAEETAALNNIHSAVIEQAMGAGAYDYAKDYVESYNLGKDVRKKIVDEEERATFDTKSVEGADALLALTDGDYTRAKQEAMKIPDGKLAKATRQEIETREVDALHARNEANKENLGTGHLLIEQGISRAALKNSPAYKALDDGGKANLLNSHDARLREKRAEASGLGDQTTKEQWEHYADLVTLHRDNPEKFKQLDIKSELWNVPKSLRDNLMTMWKSDPKDAPYESTITYSQQMSTATKGIDKDKRGMFEGAVQQEVLNAEKAKGKKLTPDETQKIIDRMQIQGEVTSGKWYKPDANKSYYETTPEERKKFAPDIPDADRQAIVEKFKARGNANPSEDDIQNIYKKWKGL